MMVTETCGYCIYVQMTSEQAPSAIICEAKVCKGFKRGLQESATVRFVVIGESHLLMMGHEQRAAGHEECAASLR